MRVFVLPGHRRDDDVALDPLPGIGGTASGTGARVPEGAAIEHHARVYRQLIAVISGVAVVGAADHSPVELRPGMLLLWEQAEVERTLAVTDLVAVVVDCVGLLDMAGRYREVTPSGAL